MNGCMTTPVIPFFWSSKTNRTSTLSHFPPMTSTERKPSTSVLMVITSFHPSPMGGSERQAFHLARSLHERGLDVSVVALGARHHPAEEIIDGIRIWRIRSALNPGSFTRKKTGRAPSAKIEYEPNDLQNFALIKRKSVFSLALYFIFYFNALRLIS